MSNNVVKMTLEDILGDRFSRYSKYIIQDRALPDIRDGLKPVQRRILYAMNVDNNVFEKPFRKSAKTVGNVIGNYHPHGDTSVYEAMVRMSQSFKLNEPLVEMHGNNGSIDGDGAAAMRYTEARLSKISSLLLTDINLETVNMIYNFDDTLLEPTVLPANFPNLLINGASGISAGYATNIPPHNLNEVMQALIFYIRNKNCRIESLFKYLKGPDFPLGGSVSGQAEIEAALKTGKGKVTLTSKYEVINAKGKSSIIISEIPYEVNKSQLVYKLEEVKEQGKISDIYEIRDESDKSGIRIVIDLKKGANSELILNYLLKNTDLQVYYNYNMVAIVDRKPKLVNVKDVLTAYYLHQVEVHQRKFTYLLNKINKRLHIIEGLVISLEDIDLLIKTIRSSKNKKDAKDNISKVFNLDEIQSEAIVSLQLYRLTNTDINDLLTEKAKLSEEVSNLQELLNNQELLDKHLITSYKQVIKDFGCERKTVVNEEITKISIDEKDLISNDEVVVFVTDEGYIKKTTVRAYKNGEFAEYGKKESDYLMLATSTVELDMLLCFTSKGNYLIVPIYELKSSKWKDLGEHISNYIIMQSDEEIVNAYVISSFDSKEVISVFTSDGYAKNVLLSSLKVSRFNKLYTLIKLQPEAVVVNAMFNNEDNVMLVSQKGYALMFASSELSVQGPKSKGIKAINLRDDTVVFANVVDNKYLLVVTNENHAKRLHIDEITLSSRARRGELVIGKLKTRDILVAHCLFVNIDEFIMKHANNFSVLKASAVNISAKQTTGSVIHKFDIEKVSKNIITLINSNNLNDISGNNNGGDGDKKSDKIHKSKLNNESKNDIMDEEVEFQEITIDDLLD